MNISTRWLLSYVTNDPSTPGQAPVSSITPEQVESALIHTGFPVESKEPHTRPDGPDTRLDVEITSNRGDCISHLGLAREFAAKTGRRATLTPVPTPTPTGPNTATSLTLDNRVPNLCPRFTARVIRGVKVGPSPAWLKDHLEAAGHRSINNVVDVTNFISLELGNPCHAFDLAKLAGNTLTIRLATPKEELTTLDGKKRVLAEDELVVADTQRAQSLAGVMGGQHSEVTTATTDIVLEMATWEDVAIRRASRRHQLRTDASYRFERIVDARTIDDAADRCAALIIQVAGGSLAPEPLAAGKPMAPLTEIRLRPARVRSVLGFDVPTDRMHDVLSRIEITLRPNGRAGDELLATVPPFRPDITREIDLIEEIGRLVGLEHIPLLDKLPVAARPAQGTELARNEINRVMTGLGYFETVSFTFTTPTRAALFQPANTNPLNVDDSRRGNEPSLRPSVIPGLLSGRATNASGFVKQPGGVRLFEIASVFSQASSGQAVGQGVETATLAAALEVTTKGKSATLAELQTGIRLMRGTIESLLRALGGAGAKIIVTPAAPHCAAFDATAFARVTVNGTDVGFYGLLTKAVQDAWSLSTPTVACELRLDALTALYPPKPLIAEIPTFPGIERDLSLIVGEDISFDRIRTAISGRTLDRMTGCEFVTTYRGAQIGKGKKSVTVRLSFRDPARTMKHEEVDAPVAGLMDFLKSDVGAEIRA